MATPEDEAIGRQLQAELRKRGMKQVTLASIIGKTPPQVSRLIKGHDVWTLDLAAKIDSLIGTRLSVMVRPKAQSVDLYVAAPITGLEDKDRVEAHHEIGRLVTVLRQHVDEVCWPGESILSDDDLKDPDLATEQNMAMLANAKAFLYLQFREVTGPTSALVELGIALGWRTHTTILIKKGIRRPFMLNQNFEGVAGRIQGMPYPRVREPESVERAADLLAKEGRHLLGLPERTRSAGQTALDWPGL